MKNNKPLCITFAGAVGSSKTPIANFLSCKLKMPVYNNDAVRTEVIEDFGFLDEKIHRERLEQRLGDIIKNQTSFICDASQDREWTAFKSKLSEYGYDWFIISLDLSKEKLVELYTRKNYNDSLPRLDQMIAEHNKFLQEYGEDINISIKDNDFKDRLQLSYSAVSDFAR